MVESPDSTEQLKPRTKPAWPKITAEIVEGFASSCLVKFFDDASQFADFHREWW